MKKFYNLGVCVGGLGGVDGKSSLDAWIILWVLSCTGPIILISCRH